MSGIKGKDAPGEETSKSPTRPIPPGFKLRLARPRSQNPKGNADVTAAISRFFPAFPRQQGRQVLIRSSDGTPRCPTTATNETD